MYRIRGEAIARKLKLSRGFSLVELLVVISIIALMIAFALPAMSRARMSSKHVRWMAYAKNISIDPDMVLHYPMFESFGSETANQALNPEGYRHYDPTAYNGTLIGDANWAEGRWPSRKGIAFTGGNSLDHVDIGNPELQGHETSFDQMTILAWFKVDAWDRQDGRIISKASGTAGRAHLWALNTVRRSGDYRLRFRLSAGGRTRTLNASSGEIQLGEWVHAAAVYDGERMYLYQDGELVGSRRQDGPIDEDNTVAAAIGNQPVGAGTRALNGVIDEVALLNRAWSQQDIIRHMNMGAP